MSRAMLQWNSFRCRHDPMGRPQHFTLLALPPIWRALRLSRIRGLRVWFRDVEIPQTDIRVTVDKGTFSPAALRTLPDRYWGAWERASIDVTMPPDFSVGPEDTVALELRYTTRRGTRTCRETVQCIPEMQ